MSLRTDRNAMRRFRTGLAVTLLQGIGLAHAQDESTLPTVIVTGELVQREARRTTTSVAVHDGAEVERSTARDVYDVIRSTPNVAVHDDSNAYGSLTIRGITSYGGSTQGGAYVYSSATSIVLDGVGLPRAAQAHADLSAFDLERVEIFRGPQSTSQGRNAMAGAVLVRSVEPNVEDVACLESLEWRGRLAGGERDTYTAAGVVDVTPIAGTLGLRAGLEHRGSDGDIRNVTRDEDDWARDASRGHKLRARWQPSGAEGIYRASFSARDLSRYVGSRYVEQSRERQREATANQPTHTRSDGHLMTLEQTVAPGEPWSFSAVSAYVNTQTDALIDLDYSAENAGTFVLDQPSRGFAQEFRARYDGELLRSTFGGYFYEGRDDDAGDATIDVNAVLKFAGLCNPPQACTAPIGNVIAYFAIPTRITDTAVFGEADWQFAERITLTTGIRYDRERSRRDYVSITRGDSPAAQTAVTTLQTSGAYGPNGRERVRRRFSTVLPKLALTYEFVDDWFAGASYTEGYRPGGGGYNPSSQRRFEFDSEQTRNFEVSFKGGWTPWGLDGALQVFHTDWRDMQVEAGSTFDVYVENAGRSEIDGGELELRWGDADLRLLGGVGLTRGQFQEYRSTRGDFSGNPLPRSPRVSSSIALEWRVLEDLMLGPELSHVGHASAQADDGPTHQLPAYTLFNLAARWKAGRTILFVNAQNLTDRHYRTDAATYGVLGTDVAALGSARRVLAGIDLQF